MADQVSSPTGANRRSTRPRPGIDRRRSFGVSLLTDILLRRTVKAMVSNDAKIGTCLEAVMQIWWRQSAGAAVLIADKTSVRRSNAPCTW